MVAHFLLNCDEADMSRSQSIDAVDQRRKIR